MGIDGKSTLIWGNVVMNGKDSLHQQFPNINEWTPNKETALSPEIAQGAFPHIFIHFIQSSTFWI